MGFPLTEQKERRGRGEKSCRENTKTEMKQSDNRSKPSGVKSGGEFKAGNLLGDALFYELGPYSFAKIDIAGEQERKERKRWKKMTEKDKDDSSSK